MRDLLLKTVLCWNEQQQSPKTWFEHAMIKQQQLIYAGNPTCKILSEAMSPLEPSDPSALRHANFCSQGNDLASIMSDQLWISGLNGQEPIYSWYVFDALDSYWMSPDLTCESCIGICTPNTANIACRA